MMKKSLAIILSVLNFMIPISASAEDMYAWADVGVKYCTENKIMEGDEHGNLNLGGNLTRAEMAKMVSVACSVEEAKKGKKTVFSDVAQDAWYYSYVLRIEDYIAEHNGEFKPSEYATREDFISSVIYAAEIVTNVEEDVISKEFSDAAEISKADFEAINAAVFHGYIIGDGGKIRPNDNLTRAEACVFLERILNTEDTPEKIPVETEKEENTKTKVEEAVPMDESIPVPTDEKYTYGAKTPIKGDSVKTLEQAIDWAKRNNAAEIFIEAAPLYWEYGEIFGIRADVMYAQAAKETGFGKYTGKVRPEMNNWAGIKKYGAVGDETDDHETFATPDDGVRGHFNHMSAYVGVDPVGETHGRYKSVKSLEWAGTVEFVEQLGGKWCPDPNYGYSILADYVDKM